MKKSFFILVFFLSLYVFYLQGFSGAFESRKNNQLIYLCQNAIQTLDPAEEQAYASAGVLANIYEGLVKFKPGTFVVEPCLATGWEISQDGRYWTFKLRPGVFFHDGTPFNAWSVKFSVDRLLKQKNPLASLVYGMVTSVQAIDNLTVRFQLKFPYAPFLNNLALPFIAPIVSPAAVKKYGADFARHPVGTGPFQFEKWDGEVILRANSNYWGKKPAIAKIVFRTERDPAQRIRLILSGKADLADITPADIPALTRKGIKVWSAPGADISYLGFYTNKKPFQNPAVRQAACRAIDQEQLLKELFAEKVTLASGPLPPTVLGYDPELRQLAYDPQQARRLLTAAGYPEGLAITLITYAGTRPYNPAGGEKLARALAKQLAGAGFQTRIVAYSWEEYKKALLNQEGDAFLYGWTGDNGDPDNFLYTLFSSAHIATGLNTTRYRHERVDTLLITAQRTRDPALRARLYRDVQKQLLEDVPGFFLNHSLTLVAASPAIENVPLQPGGYLYLPALTQSKQ